MSFLRFGASSLKCGNSLKFVCFKKMYSVSYFVNKKFKPTLRVSKVGVEIPLPENASEPIKHLYCKLDTYMEKVADKMIQDFSTSLTTRNFSELRIVKENGAVERMDQIATIILKSDKIVISPHNPDKKTNQKIMSVLKSFRVPLFPVLIVDTLIECPFPKVTQYMRQQIYASARNYIQSVKKNMHGDGNATYRKLIAENTGTDYAIRQNGIIQGILKIYNEKLDELLESKREDLHAQK